jgi:hypothetical protein
MGAHPKSSYTLQTLSANSVCRQFADYICRLSPNTLSSPEIPLISQFKTSCGVMEFALALCLFNERRRRRKSRWWWTRHFLKEGTRYGNKHLVDLKVEDGADFRNFVKMTQTDIKESNTVSRLVLDRSCWVRLFYAKLYVMGNVVRD